MQGSGRSLAFCGGPKDAAERGWWELIEDPFLGEIHQLETLEKLDFIPNLERIEPKIWPEQAQIAPHLAKRCEERRHYVVTESSGQNRSRKCATLVEVRPLKR